MLHMHVMVTLALALQAEECSISVVTFIQLPTVIIVLLPSWLHMVTLTEVYSCLENRQIIKFIYV